MKKIIVIILAFPILFIACKHELPIVTTDPTKPIVSASCSPDTVYFQNDILPIFQTYCAKSGCHDAANHREGIILTDYTNIITTGQIRGGSPSHGGIYHSISSPLYDNFMPPPPDAPLSADMISKIKKWIEQGALNNSCNAGCDTLDVKYSTKVTTLLTNKCIGCHNSASAGGGINLANYAGVQTVALNGRLLGSVKYTTGYKQMPQGGDKLSDCEINIFQIWINAGAPNN